MDWLLVNSLSGSGRGRSLCAAVRTRFKEHAITCEEKIADTIPEIQDIAAKAVQAHVSRLWVLGGDGSLSAAASSLCYSRTILCPLPGGTAGVFCRELSIPDSASNAVTAMLEGDPADVDIGQIWPWDASTGKFGPDGSDTKFLLMASVGLDAAAVRDVNLGLKQLIGPGAYILSGFFKFLGCSCPRLTITDDHGIDQIGYQVFVQNSRLYGGSHVMAPKAKLDDGRFDVILLKNPTRQTLIRFMLEIRSGRHVRLPDVEYFRSASLVVKCEEPEAVQADGDCVTKLPVRMTLLPKALRVLAPKCPPRTES